MLFYKSLVCVFKGSYDLWNNSVSKKCRVELCVKSDVNGFCR